MLLTVKCWPSALALWDQVCWGNGCKNLLEEFKIEWEARIWKPFQRIYYKGVEKMEQREQKDPERFHLILFWF